MVSFPVYVRDDAGDVTSYASLEKMQGYMEPIDVENNEYEVWDAAGFLLELSVGNPKSEWLNVKRSDRALSEDQFAEIKSKTVPYREPEPLLRSLGRVLGIVKVKR